MCITSTTASPGSIAVTVTVCGVLQAFGTKVRVDVLAVTLAPAAASGTITVTVTVSVGREVSTTS